MILDKRFRVIKPPKITEAFFISIYFHFYFVVLKIKYTFGDTLRNTKMETYRIYLTKGECAHIHNANNETDALIQFYLMFDNSLVVTGIAKL